MKKRQQIMIVLWKWINLGGGVNAKIFGEKKYKSHLLDIKKGEGVYFKEYPVEYSEVCPDAKFVQASIYKDDDNTAKLFFALLDYYVKENCDVLLFLHRGHFYSDKDVTLIRTRFGKKNIKCFLFADGRDYIYYATQKSGLLNDAGSFFIGRDLDTNEFVKTFDKKKLEVKQPYFDRVWAHYRDEFQGKIFALKEEFFNCWFELLLPSQPEQIEVEKVIERLNFLPERALVFRAKSFLGLYKNDGSTKVTDPTEHFKLKKEVHTVEELERNEGKSYLFDDAIANLEHEKERERPLVVEKYDETAELLEQILFSSKKMVDKSTLRELADRFNSLVQVIPGELSN